ncbi:MAG: DUF2069 domain-containing protein [Perlucidibaca sp.]
MTADHALLTQANQLHRYCRRGLIALIVWLALETVVLAPQGMPVLAMLVFWLLQSVALMLFLPGIHAGRARSAVWLGFVLLFYFIFAVLRAFGPGLAGKLALVELALEVGLFFIAIRYVKAKRATQGGAL